ncbi:MAG: hypothetical protein Q7W16_09155 [Coriobacteriia bacterium]|nr:hypothetical protein [Coriobacteriia bacterium]
MKLGQNRSSTAASGRIATVLAAAALFSLLLSTPAPAHAITRDEVIARASNWVNLRLHYSRRAHFGGYRRDCSGMVSMAWGLGRSYTSRTIASRAVRIPIGSLQPGDAVRTPGHVAIFARWANRRTGMYVALEQSGRKAGAVRRVRRLGRGAMALRLRGITDAPAAVAALVPAPAAMPTITVAAVSLP